MGYGEKSKLERIAELMGHISVVAAFVAVCYSYHTGKKISEECYRFVKECGETTIECRNGLIKCKNEMTNISEEWNKETGKLLLQSASVCKEIKSYEECANMLEMAGYAIKYDIASLDRKAKECEKSGDNFCYQLANRSLQMLCKKGVDKCGDYSLEDPFCNVVHKICGIFKSR